MKKYLAGMLCAAMAVSSLGFAATADETESFGFDGLAKENTFVVGFDAEYPPYGYMDDNGDYTGFDLELAEAVCEIEGWELVKTPIDWDSKDMELNSGNIDCIWNGMSVDSARARAMNLSDPYLMNRVVFVVKDSSLSHLDSIKGKRIGVQKASTAQLLLDKSEVGESAKEIVLIRDLVPEIEALDSGTVDAIYVDEVFAKYWNHSHGMAYTILEEGLYNEFYAVGFRKKDKSLRDTVNSILNELKRDGMFVELSVKWFGK